MPTASGSFSGNANDFHGRFLAEGFAVPLLGGKFAQTITSFNVPNATITYNQILDFAGEYSIEAASRPSFVGETTIDITFRNARSIVLHLTGTLEHQIDERFVVIGRGRWGQE
jgi:hypothetical protein